MKMKNVFRSGVALWLCTLLFASQACDSGNQGNGDPTDSTDTGTDIVIAELLQNSVSLAADEAEKHYWFPANGPVYLLVSNQKGLNLSISDAAGKAPLPEQLQVERAPFENKELTLFILQNAEGIFYLNAKRINEGDTRPLDGETALMLAKMDEVYDAEDFERSPVLHSPYIVYADGKEVKEAQEANADFGKEVQERFGYNPEEGTPFLSYVMESELMLSVCGLANLFLPPAGAPGPTPPANAKHSDNYCGMSVFIHSMESYFPGALDPKASTDKDEWDKVGDNIDHSNTFGERGCKLVSEVNDNYRDGNASANGKKYCARELDDTSAENLAAWAKDCNLKLLVYDLPEFGHWVDVVAVNDTTLTIQDYGSQYTAEYDADNENVDFNKNGTAGSSTMGKEFDSDNPIAGDALDEIVDFYVVCECEKDADGDLDTPKKNSAGKDLED